jgi:RHS repeat-associated protein
MLIQLSPGWLALRFSALHTEHHFTGKERDAESGNDYFGARYYGSSMGRFLSPDWAAAAEAVPYANFASPQTLNLYAYVGNNPISRVDPDGHVPLSWGGLEDCEERHDCNGGGQTDADVKANQAALQAEAQARAQQQSQPDAKTAKINSRAQSQYNNDVPIIAKQLGVSTDEVLNSVHIAYDDNGRAVVIGGHVNMNVDDGSDAQTALAAKLGPGPHGYNEDAATGQGQGSEFSRLGTTPSVHLDNGLMHVDRFNASAWGGLGTC